MCIRDSSCRGGSESAYSFGADASDLGKHAWYAENAWDIGEQYAHEIGEKLSNHFGLHDMHGNVWEWCGDWYDDDYDAATVQDPRGPNSGSSRVLRGGSWVDLAIHCRSANRVNNDPSERVNYIGFRVVLVR